MPKQNLNIKADLKKYKSMKPRGRPPTYPVRFVVNGNLMSAAQVNEIVTDFIPGTKPRMPVLSLSPPPPHIKEDDPTWKAKEMEYRREEMDKVVSSEEERMQKMAADPNQLVSPFQRTIYLNCGHKVTSYISSIKLNSYYYCFECVLFKKVQEVVY